MAIAEPGWVSSSDPRVYTTYAGWRSICALLEISGAHDALPDFSWETPSQSWSTNVDPEADYEDRSTEEELIPQPDLIGAGRRGE